MPEKYTDRRFSREAVKNLNEILSYTRSKIVVTSNWRLSLSLTELKEIFRTEGIYNEVIGKTGIDVTRGEEISEWIRTNNVTDYVVIDDQVSDIVSVLGNKRVVDVDHKRGLDNSIVDKVLDILF